jgi:hypothetical protein
MFRNMLGHLKRAKTRLENDQDHVKFFQSILIYIVVY